MSVKMIIAKQFPRLFLLAPNSYYSIIISRKKTRKNSGKGGFPFCGTGRRTSGSDQLEDIMTENRQEKQLCIFDLDGTLADTVRSIAFSGNLTLSALGYAPLPVEHYCYYAGDGAKELARRFLYAAKLSAQQAEAVSELFSAPASSASSPLLPSVPLTKDSRQTLSALCQNASAAVSDDDPEFRLAFAKYRDIFSGHCMDEVRPFPGILELLSELRARGVRTAVLSNKPHLQTLDVVKKLFGDDCFDQVQGQLDGVPKKPAPDGALRIASKFGIAPALCLYVGDTDTDMQTGTRAGMFPVGVLWGFRDEAELKRHHAAALIRKPEELLSLL